MRNAQSNSTLLLRSPFLFPQTPFDLPRNPALFSQKYHLPQNSNTALCVKAAKLRANPTPREAALWDQLRSKRLQGVKFRRQHIALGYILDFWCPEYGIAVEMDGTGHDQVRDQKRDNLFSGWKVTTLRFQNATPLDEVVSVIRGVVQAKQAAVIQAAAVKLSREKAMSAPARTDDWYQQRRVQLQTQTRQLALIMPSSVKKLAETEPEALAVSKGMHVTESGRRQA